MKATSISLTTGCPSCGYEVHVPFKAGTLLNAVPTKSGVATSTGLTVKCPPCGTEIEIPSEWGHDVMHAGLTVLGEV